MLTEVRSIPSQAMFKTADAAQYLGINRKTLQKLTDLGELPARTFGRRRAYLIEDLDDYRRNLPDWPPEATMPLAGENPPPQKGGG